LPWYIPATTKWKLKTWWKGVPQPDLAFCSDGYRFLELGPDELVGKWRVEMAEMECGVRSTC